MNQNDLWQKEREERGIEEGRDLTGHIDTDVGAMDGADGVAQLPRQAGRQVAQAHGLTRRHTAVGVGEIPRGRVEMLEKILV